MSRFRVLLASVSALSCGLYFTASSMAGPLTENILVDTTTRTCPTAVSGATCIEETELGAGSIENWQATGSTSASTANTDGTNWIQSSFDEGNYSLPVIHFDVSSGTQERSTVNTYMFQKYLWTGDAVRLSIRSFYEVNWSNGTWGDGYNAWVWAYTTVLQDVPNGPLEGEFWPDVASQTRLSTIGFFTPNDMPPSYTSFDYMYGPRFDVLPGQEFYLYTAMQGGASNGGWANLTGSFSNEISAFQIEYSDQGFPIGERLPDEIVASGLVVVDGRAAKVPEPGAFALIFLALLAMALANRNTSPMARNMLLVKR